MLNTIFSRKSVRRWPAGGIDAKQLHEILHAAMSAPSAGNEQAWQFIVLDDPGLIEQYQAINNNMPRRPPLAILICGDLQLEKYPGFHVQDCAAATTNLLLAVTAQGLGAVWTTVFPQNVEPTRQLLGLPAHVVPFACVPIGQLERPAEPHDRFNASRVHTNGW